MRSLTNLRRRSIGERLLAAAAPRWSWAAIVVLLAAGLAVSACSDEPSTGPVEIHYDRDTCDFCRMIISDPRFAAQIRGGPGHKAYKFDDIGDALLFLDRQPWKDEAGVEFWVMDVETGKTWLDARKAHYMSGLQSPMAHGFGALPAPRTGSVDFETMRKKAAERSSRVYCLPDKHDETHQSILGQQSVVPHE